MGACPPVVAGNFFKDNWTLNSARFVLASRGESPRPPPGLCLWTPLGKATGNSRSESQKFPLLSVKIPENSRYENTAYASRV